MCSVLLDVAYAHREAPNAARGESELDVQAREVGRRSGTGRGRDERAAAQDVMRDLDVVEALNDPSLWVVALLAVEIRLAVVVIVDFVGDHARGAARVRCAIQATR